MKRICLFCKKEFYFRAFPSNINRKKYCSKHCQYEYRNTRIEKICRCGKSFFVNIARKEKAKYCSQKCSQIFQIRNGYKNGHFMPKGEQSPYWKGIDINYSHLHTWVRRQLGKAMYCSDDVTHIAKKYFWANISGLYKRDLTDWKPLCPSCNQKDGVKIHPRFFNEIYARQ